MTRLTKRIKARSQMATKQIRPIRVDGNIAYVTLTRGYVAVIDAADVPSVDGVNWFAAVRPHTVYAVRKGPRPRQEVFYLHRVIMAPPDDLEVDHIDRNGLNNLRTNLRNVSASDNQCNRLAPAANTSGVKGVSRFRNKWQAQIKRKGASYHLGLFGCPTAAHLAYVRANARLHGEFGRTA